jgi:hypothetical protein
MLDGDSKKQRDSFDRFYRPKSQTADGFYSPRGLFSNFWGTNDIDRDWLYARGPRWRAIAKARGYSRKQIREAAQSRRRGTDAFGTILAVLKHLPIPSTFVPLVEPWTSGPMFELALHPTEAGYKAAADYFGVSSPDSSDGLHVVDDRTGYGSFVMHATVDPDAKTRAFINGHPKEVWDAGICIVENCGKLIDKTCSAPFCEEHAKGLVG